MLTNCHYRVSAKALIKNEEGKLLFVEEKENNGYELPGGGIENGESPQQALKREIREELGVDATNIADTATYVWIINGEVIWLLYEATISTTSFEKNVHVANAGFFDIDNLQEQEPSKLGYCCSLYKDDLMDYLSK